MTINLSNGITISRIGLIIPICICSLLSYSTAAWYLFSIAALSDLVDGYVARKLSHATKFGALLDSYADKMLVIIMFILLIAKGLIHSKTQLILVLIIVFREFLVLLLRIYLYETGNTLNASYAAKLKTGLQLTAIFTLLYPDLQDVHLYLANLALFVAAVLSVTSSCQYVYIAKPSLES